MNTFETNGFIQCRKVGGDAWTQLQLELFIQLAMKQGHTAKVHLTNSIAKSDYPIERI